MDLTPVYVTCISIALTTAESDTFENQRIMAGGYIYPDRLGFLQCKSLCCRYGGCSAVSYLKEHCLCELHGLNSGQRDMSGHMGSVTWIKNAAEKESCREYRCSCQSEEQCLFTGRGEFKCVPARRYFANEMRLKSKRIPSNVELVYLERWGPSKEQTCGKHDNNPLNVTSVSLGDEKISVYYMVIRAQRNKTVFNPETFDIHQGPKSVVPFFTVDCYSKLAFMITANKRSIRIYVTGARPHVYPYPSDLISGLKMDIAVLFCPKKNTLSTFVLKMGNHKTTNVDYRKTYADISLPAMDYFCSQSFRRVALGGGCGVGVSSKLLPFEETKQYTGILENSLNAFLHEKTNNKTGNN